MANLDDLNIPSITDMNNDEALELLRTIRLSRRTPTKKFSKTTKKKIQKAKDMSKVSPELASKLLELLGG